MNQKQTVFSIFALVGMISLGACGEHLSALPGGGSIATDDDASDAVDVAAPGGVDLESSVRGLAAEKRVYDTRIDFTSKANHVIRTTAVHDTNSDTYIIRQNETDNGGNRVIGYDVRIPAGNIWRRACYVMGRKVMSYLGANMQMETYFQSINKADNGRVNRGIGTPTCLVFTQDYNHGRGNAEINPAYGTLSPAPLKEGRLYNIDLVFAQTGANRIMIQDHGDKYNLRKLVITEVSQAEGRARDCLDIVGDNAASGQGLRFKTINAGYATQVEDGRSIHVTRVQAKNITCYR